VSRSRFYLVDALTKYRHYNSNFCAREWCLENVGGLTKTFQQYWNSLSGDAKKVFIYGYDYVDTDRDFILSAEISDDGKSSGMLFNLSICIFPY
jgi:hypothetical protein